jgi:hypothetical protein
MFLARRANLTALPSLLAARAVSGDAKLASGRGIISPLKIGYLRANVPHAPPTIGAQNIIILE